MKACEFCNSWLLDDGEHHLQCPEHPDNIAWMNRKEWWQGFDFAHHKYKKYGIYARLHGYKQGTSESFQAGYCVASDKLEVVYDWEKLISVLQ